MAIPPRRSADRDVGGYEICLAWDEAGEEEWRCTLYPFAGSAMVLDRDPLTFCGVPAAILFRPDLSLVTLFGIDPSTDYLNPTPSTSG
ncbi:MAG: hypothetical protein HY717_04165 [Planctomycetes bacterium]|nr:hypothetical protein [Planctomycetota bacterium]